MTRRISGDRDSAPSGAAATDATPDWAPAIVVMPELPGAVRRLLATPLHRVAASSTDRDALAAAKIAPAAPAKLERSPETEKKSRVPITGFVSYRDVMEAIRCSKSAAYRHLRKAVGRPNGTHKALRAPVDMWERYARRTLGR